MLLDIGYQNAVLGSASNRSAEQRALKMFRHARAAALIKAAFAGVAQKSRELPLLQQNAGRGSYAGVHTVPLQHIRGSEGRRGDFDIEFLPLTDHTSGRWQSVASARLEGLALPAVKLLKAGDAYYVRDGHHRISVARTMGEAAIEAEVTVVA